MWWPGLPTNRMTAARFKPVRGRPRQDAATPWFYVPKRVTVAGRVTQLPMHSADYLLLATFAPGDYTLRISPSSSGTGIVLAEVYDLP